MAPPFLPPNSLPVGNLRRKRSLSSSTSAMTAPSSPPPLSIPQLIDGSNMALSCIDRTHNLEPPLSKRRFCSSSDSACSSDVCLAADIAAACYSNAERPPMAENHELKDPQANCLRFYHLNTTIDLPTICECIDDSDVGRIDTSGADELLICEMMQSLEQAIGKSTHAEDSSSCSSSPTSNTSSCARWDIDREQTSDCGAIINSSAQECFNIFDDCSPSIDEEIQQLLRQAADHSLINFCGQLDDYSTTLSDANLYPFYNNQLLAAANSVVCYSGADEAVTPELTLIEGPFDSF